MYGHLMSTIQICEVLKAIIIFITKDFLGNDFV